MGLSNMGLVIVLAVVTYATRITGFKIGDRRLPPALDRFLTYVPVASFAALAVPGVADGAGTLPARVVGAVAASIVVLRFSYLWAGLLAGMGAFWLVMGVK